MNAKKQIEVEVEAAEPIEKIWEYWTEPDHIKNWCFASDDWCVPRADNDLKVGGKFDTRMESKDGKVGFDFEGTYTNIEEYKKIEYIMSDGRQVEIDFIEANGVYKIVEKFDPEDINPVEMQKDGWQAILNNFKKYLTY